MPPPPALVGASSRGRPPPLNVQIEIGGAVIEGLSDSYAEANGLLAIIGSFYTLEIALKNGSAASKLSLEPAAPVTVRRNP